MTRVGHQAVAQTRAKRPRAARHGWTTWCLARALCKQVLLAGKFRDVLALVVNTCCIMFVS